MVLVGKQNKMEPKEVSISLKSIPTLGMTLNEIQVSQDEADSLKCLFQFSVSDITTANSSISELNNNIRTAINNLNKNTDAVISYYEVRINSPTDEPLLRYINDIQFSHFSGWKADSLSMDWSSIK
jgi:hypothetical protein